MRRIGLLASEAFWATPQSPLFRFFRSFAPFLTDELGAELHVLGRTHDALKAEGLLGGRHAIVRLAPAQEGGLVTLTALLVGLDNDDPGLDQIIYLQDPRDPISLFPEALAIKRQCVVHDKPFLSTEAAASEWCALEWHRQLVERGADTAPIAGLIDRWVRPERLGAEGVALIAHDRMKAELVDYARTHRSLLNRFGRRMATGTTGALLNGRRPERLADSPFVVAPIEGEAMPTDGRPWVDGMRSGPQGGDAQIAQEILLGHCRRTIFLEDPHVAREHEADIQLLERATRFAADGCLCLNSRATADRWAENMELLLARRPG